MIVPIPPLTTENDRSEKRRHQAGLESAEFVRAADEHVVHGGHAAAHRVRRAQLHEAVADDDADVVERTGQQQHQQRQPEQV